MPPMAPMAPLPPAAGAAAATATATATAPRAQAFQPIELKPFVNENKQPSPNWSVKDYVDIDKLSAGLASVLGIAPPRMDIAETTMEGLSKVMGIPYYADEPTLNPIAWTSPEGRIHMATDAPEYSSGGVLDAAKIRSTIVHESVHAASHDHTGFQQTTKEAGINSNWNYDEFATDYFAHKVYRTLYPDADYKTNYFTTDLGGRPKVWGGNLIGFMIQSGHMREADIRSAYANGDGSLALLEGEKLDAWKQYAKTGRATGAIARAVATGATTPPEGVAQAADATQRVDHRIKQAATGAAISSAVAGAAGAIPQPPAKVASGVIGATDKLATDTQASDSLREAAGSSGDASATKQAAGENPRAKLDGGAPSGDRSAPQPEAGDAGATASAHRPLPTSQPFKASDASGERLADKLLASFTPLDFRAAAQAATPGRAAAAAPSAESAIDARARQLAQPVTGLAGALIDALGGSRDPQGGAALRRLAQKNQYGEFEIGAALARRLTDRPSAERGAGIELNDAYLQLLQAVVTDSDSQAVAREVAKLLRSPDHEKSGLSRLLQGKLPGYYKAVLDHGVNHPQLLASMKGLLAELDDKAAQARPGDRAALDKLTGKIKNQFDEVVGRLREPLPETAAASKDSVKARLENIKLRAWQIAQRKAAEEHRQTMLERAQEQLQSQLNERLKSHGLNLPDYMRASLGDAHLSLLRALHEQFGQRMQASGDSVKARFAQRLDAARASVGAVRARVDEFEQRLAELKAQPRASATKSEKATVETALKAEKKALKEATRAFEDVADSARRALDGAQYALRHETRAELIRAMLDSGVFVENKTEEADALKRCLESSQAKDIVMRAVERAKDYSGLVDKDKAIRVASEALVRHVMNDRFFVDKMARIQQSFSNLAARREAGQAAPGVALHDARREAASGAEHRVGEAVSSQVKAQAATAAEQVARKQAQTEAALQAERAAKDAAMRAAQRDAQQQAEREAQRKAEQEAERRARESAESAARDAARRAAEEKAAQAARQQAEQEARRGIERAAAERAHRIWADNFNRQLQRADGNLRDINLEERLDRLRNGDIEERLDRLREDPPRPDPATRAGARQAQALTSDGKPRIV
ncbi:coiled-coil domain-containing protein [Burkholderia savannae]|uniref:hypothetical protein n=1 Tax=Burkholderia savannae TaxID=1637837 RepID=UPI001CF7E03E|nr:hypothetical protein [Burkholderia savannae]